MQKNQVLKILRAPLYSTLVSMPLMLTVNLTCTKNHHNYLYLFSLFELQLSFSAQIRRGSE